MQHTPVTFQRYCICSHLVTFVRVIIAIKCLLFSLFCFCFYLSCRGTRHDAIWPWQRIYWSVAENKAGFTHEHMREHIEVVALIRTPTSRSTNFNCKLRETLWCRCLFIFIYAGAIWLSIRLTTHLWQWRDLSVVRNRSDPSYLLLLGR